MRIGCLLDDGSKATVGLRDGNRPHYHEETIAR